LTSGETGFSNSPGSPPGSTPHLDIRRTQRPSTQLLGYLLAHSISPPSLFDRANSTSPRACVQPSRYERVMGRRDVGNDVDIMGSRLVDRRSCRRERSARIPIMSLRPGPELRSPDGVGTMTRVVSACLSGPGFGWGHSPAYPSLVPRLGPNPGCCARKRSSCRRGVCPEFPCNPPPAASG
jgi:hypothetical protein